MACDGSHGFQGGFSGEDVAEKTEGESDGAENDRNQLKETDKAEDHEHHHGHDAGELALGGEDVFEEAYEAVFADGPVEPQKGEGDRHRQGHVQVGVTAAQEGAEGIVAVATEAIGVELSDGAHAGDQTEPVREQNQHEDGAEEPERFFHQMSAENSFEKVVEAFDKPFDEVLQARRNQGDFARGQLGYQNQNCCHDPDHEHRVADGDRTQSKKFLCMNGQVVVSSASRLCGLRGQQ